MSERHRAMIGNRPAIFIRAGPRPSGRPECAIEEISSMMTGVDPVQSRLHPPWLKSMLGLGQFHQFARSRHAVSPVALLGRISMSCGVRSLPGAVR
eukprot:2801210-Pyramimonas_sp.AAC.1